MTNDPLVPSTAQVAPPAGSDGDGVVQQTNTSDIAVVVLTAALWPLGAVAMFFARNWSLANKIAAVGLVLVVGLVFSFSVRLSGGATAAAVTAYLLWKHPTPTRTLKVAGWTTTAAVAVLCLVGLYVPPLAHVGWH